MLYLQNRIAFKESVFNSLNIYWVGAYGCQVLQNLLWSLCKQVFNCCLQYYLTMDFFLYMVMLQVVKDWKFLF